jgi:hypothetical protein
MVAELTSKRRTSEAKTKKRGAENYVTDGPCLELGNRSGVFRALDFDGANWIVSAVRVRHLFSPDIAGLC